MAGAAARQLFLAATGQNRGKTTTSLGLFAALRSRGLKTGFMKPVGQRWIMIDGVPADEDAARTSRKSTELKEKLSRTARQGRECVAHPTENSKRTA